MNKRGIIVSGGSIDYEFCRHTLNGLQADYIIAVDGGLEFLYHSQIEPTHIVGDFDSVDASVIAYYKKQTSIPIREFHPVKDASDTEIAVRYAIELGVEELWLLGATGTRLDHVMANIQVLKIALDANVKAYILDVCNRISLVEREAILVKGEAYGDYFSIFPFDGVVEGVSIRGAKYPLENYRLCPYDSRCVSNEMQEERVEITFSDGILLLMETRDKK